MAEMIVTRKDNIRYKIPERKIIKVLSTHNNTPHSIGFTFISRIPISINGTANIANFFHILKTRSEKNTTNNNDAEINRGVKIKKTYFSLNKKSKQE